MTNESLAFTALGDPTRQLLLERLAKRPMPVGKLAAGLNVTRPAVSQHLKVLYDAGLVSVRQQGTRRIYQVDPKGIEAMRTYLDRFWDRSLAALKAAAEMAEDQRPPRRPRTPALASSLSASKSS
jgi:DNA-binding transcriptional ArsR family regulator